MSTLVLATGGTGKTGRRLAAQLREHAIPCRVAARGVAPSQGTRPFDWSQPDSWDAALEGVVAAYLVAPSAIADPAPLMIEFLQHAQEQGVARFVLLSASPLPAGGPAMGQVHLWLQEHAAEWTVLRPTWFMQNLSEGQHLPTIRDEDRIYSAAEDGRVPFVSTDDVATVARVALTRAYPFNTDFVLTGSQTLSYDEVAARISTVVGRKISHHRLTPDLLAARYRSGGLGPIYAQTLAAMDAAVARGAENRVTTCVESVTGQPPSTFGAFTEANATAWNARR